MFDDATSDILEILAKGLLVIRVQSKDLVVICQQV